MHGFDLGLLPTVRIDVAFSAKMGPDDLRSVRLYLP